MAGGLGSRSAPGSHCRLLSCLTAVPHFAPPAWRALAVTTGVHPVCRARAGNVWRPEPLGSHPPQGIPPTQIPNAGSRQALTRCLASPRSCASGGHAPPPPPSPRHTHTHAHNLWPACPCASATLAARPRWPLPCVHLPACWAPLACMLPPSQPSAPQLVHLQPAVGAARRACQV